MEYIIRDMSQYNMDCGSCGEAFSWEDYERSNLFCPYCGWDSVRISVKETNETNR